jgi:hypothetical protein
LIIVNLGELWRIVVNVNKYTINPNRYHMALSGLMSVFMRIWRINDPLVHLIRSD